MKDAESIQRKLEAFVKVEEDRLEAARHAVYLGRWGMIAASIGVLLSLAALQQDDIGVWARALTLAMVAAIGYGFGRIDLWLKKRAQPSKNHWTAWFR